jgi:hypothetical protein
VQWEEIKERACVVYTRVAHLLLFLALVLYLVASGIADKPIGAKAYVEFLYHVIQWTPNRTPVGPTVHAKER